MRSSFFLASENIQSAEYDLFATVLDFMADMGNDLIKAVEDAKNYAETVYQFIAVIIPKDCQAIMIAMVSVAILYLILGRN